MFFKTLYTAAAAGLMLLGTACSSLLELEPLEPSDITVQELIVRMNHATDPKQAYRGCKSYLIKQNLYVMQSGTKDVMTSEVRFQAPDKMRITTFRSGKPTTVEIYNAGKGWRIDCGTGKVAKVPEGLPIELMRIFTQMGTPSLDATRIFKKVTIDMKVEDGFKTYRLICDPCIDGIAPYVQYISGKTYLAERLETVMYANGTEYLYVSVPADYTWYGDIRLPASSTVELMNITRISKMAEFRINVDFPDSDFLPPEPAFSNNGKAKTTGKTAVKKEPAKETADNTTEQKPVQTGKDKAK